MRGTDAYLFLPGTSPSTRGAIPSIPSARRGRKGRLLSLDESVRFVFRYSALREGWANPNISQICTLMESGYETSKRWEVGRGMRPYADQDGVRQDAPLLDEDEVQSVNVLTVIVSESFAKDLQADISNTLRNGPKRSSWTSSAGGCSRSMVGGGYGHRLVTVCGDDGRVLTVAGPAVAPLTVASPVHGAI